MDATTPANPNPYHPGDPLAPFAGRQDELARLDHYLKDPAANAALVFMGRRWLGKTALLQRFDSVFDDQFVHAHLPLKLVDLSSENALLQAITDAVADLLAERDITISRIPSPDPDAPILRDWFSGTWLPGIFQIIRSHRKLVLLMDDAHVWLDAESGEGWHGATFDFFHDLLQQHPQLRIVLTFAAEREDHLTKLNPLVSPAHIQRLGYLTTEATGWLLRYPGLYAVPDESVTAVQRSTGGHPQLLQRFAHHIYQYHDTHPGERTITPQIIRTLTPGVYHASIEELANIWAESTDVEQFVLVAFSQIRYNDPLKAITADVIAAWLLDSDYPLDQTAVNAALRGLEYREVVVLRSSGIELTCHMLQTWLLENTIRGTARAVAVPELPVRLPVIIAAVVIVVVALVLLISLSNTPQTETAATSPPAPTVTLAGSDAPE